VILAKYSKFLTFLFRRAEQRFYRLLNPKRKCPSRTPRFDFSLDDAHTVIKKVKRATDSELIKFWTNRARQSQFVKIYQLLTTKFAAECGSMVVKRLRTFQNRVGGTVTLLRPFARKVKEFDLTQNLVHPGKIAEKSALYCSWKPLKTFIQKWGDVPIKVWAEKNSSFKKLDLNDVPHLVRLFQKQRPV